jgi:SAM-dependent methyltransferase
MDRPPSITANSSPVAPELHRRGRRSDRLSGFPRGGEAPFPMSTPHDPTAAPAGSTTPDAERARRSPRWFPFLRWPLMRYRDEVDLTPPNGFLDDHVQKSDFSLRLQRYWWAARKLGDESAAADQGSFVVVDLGCERGWLRRFTPQRASIVWIGLDGNVSHPSLSVSGYDRVIACNFDEPLPLSDASADAVVSLHVFEHLPNPERTLAEVARILKPGGCFLAGSPTGPGPVSWIRTRMLRARAEAGRNRHWGHLQKLSPAGWHALCSEAGLTPEFVTGSHLIRRTGASLENRPWWIRLNQLWGALFPSLGQEVYLSARKLRDAPGRVRGWWSRLWLNSDWLAPVACLVLLATVVLGPLGGAASFADEIAAHQDGNDVFVLCSMVEPSVERRNRALDVIGDVALLKEVFAEAASRQKDLHVIVEEEDLDAYRSHALGGVLRVADRWIEGDRVFVVLSKEAKEPFLSGYGPNR